MNIKDYTLKVTYKLNGKEITVSGNDDILSFTDIGGENSVKLKVRCTRPVELIMAELIYDRYFETNERFFANGYQSWSTSREYQRGDYQYGLRNVGKLPVVKPFSAISGDYNFTEYGKDLYHGFTYTYLRRDESVELIGSLNERTGYTVFYADFKDNVFAIVKDVEGLRLNGDEYELFDFAAFEGSYDEVFDKYFEAFPGKHTGRVQHFSGYTSWYNYFQNINEEIILRDLEGLKTVGAAANIFQIDDGYETMVGDWETDAEKFPNGLKPIVDKIHDAKLLAGLWIAPFSAQFKAEIVKKHPEWLIKKPNGKKLIGGFAWNGFYVLDIDIPEVRAYIKAFFDKVFDEYGFDMVKLDFLYSICALPRNGKTRGQIMCEAMDFLRECCRDKIILGCGVPLGPSFGIVDACRISCDVELSFKDKYYTKCTNQEIISAKTAMNNSIFRRHLNGRIFANDPDVFFLRDDGAKPAKFTMEQKKLLARINHMFGSVLFVSDDIGAYDAEKREVLLESYKKFNGKVIMCEYIAQDILAIKYIENGQKYLFVYNALTGENSTKEIK
jgi:alpha-galactosidase